MKRQNKGFTLIELLVSIAIVAVLSALSTQLLFDTISVESKERILSNSSDTSYQILEQIAQGIRQGKSVNVPSASTIAITNETTCIVYRYNAGDKSIEKGEDVGCSPASFTSLTEDSYVVNNFSFSPVGSTPDSVTIVMDGDMKGALGSHPFSYKTNVMPRL